MVQKIIKNFKKLVANFRALKLQNFKRTTRIRQKNLQETNLVLGACKKEYQKL